ncbi:MAG: hypothetical protein IK004_05380 [Bacteroidales bacterium]|nr:hypothetical protein [Bacteroidales bacterium]
MDDSWNFLIEAPEDEFNLIREACRKSNIDVSDKSNSEEIVDGICKHFSSGLTYEQFLVKVCEKLYLDTDGEIEQIELSILKQILFEGIRKMDIELAKKFASSYDFSNYKDKEKLINEVKVRIDNSKSFASKLAIIDAVLFGVDPTEVIPSDSINNEISFSNEQLYNYEFGLLPIASGIIILQLAHRHVDYEEVEKYIDKAILRTVQGDDFKKPYLSAMLELYESKEDVFEGKDVINRIKKYVDNYKAVIPDYILKAISSSNYHQDIIDHIMKKMFLCDEQKQGSYFEASCKAEGEGKVAFFDYMFPYTTAKTQNFIFLMPEDVIEQKFIELYLLCQGKSPNDCLFTEKDLLKEDFDCAVLSYNNKRYDWKSNIKLLYTEDAILEGWRNFFKNKKTITTVDDYKALIEFLSLFINPRYSALSPELKKIIVGWVNDHHEFERIKVITQGLYGFEKFKGLFKRNTH